MVSRAIQQSPGQYGHALVHAVLDLASKLKYYDPRRLQEEDMEDPEWLVALGKTAEALDVSEFHTFTEARGETLTCKF